MRSKQARSFSRKHRRYLAILSGGLCAICGKELDLNFHADHIFPFSRGGRTLLNNGQALCPTCNLSKGDSIMSVGTPVLRDWQKKAMDAVFDEWEKDKSKPLVAACPGSGKTIFSVEATRHAINNFGIDFVVVVTPTVNIKKQWHDDFKKAGIKMHLDATNRMLKDRLALNSDPREKKIGLCITYQQAASDKDLFYQLVSMFKTLVIADEIHHADDDKSFGEAIEGMAEVANLRLALSGTPFNSSGGVLAMCPCEIDINEEGKRVRKTLPVYKYSYADALSAPEGVCRPVEFIKICGESTVEYRNLLTQNVWDKVVKLSKKNDSLRPFIMADSAFFEKMAVEALKALEDMKRTDPKSAMLVVAKDVSHGHLVCQKLTELCDKNPKWSGYQFAQIYHDTIGANKRIEQFNYDNTDIIVSVRMISEGVDVKRLKVGLYATDFTTRMFFVQFVGRFVRWESHLGVEQHARIIIPAHISICEYAKEIEEMIDQSIIPDETPPPPPPPPPGSEIIGVETIVNGEGILFRGQQSDETALAEMFFQKHESLRGVITMFHAIQAAKDANMDAGYSSEQGSNPSEKDWGNLNEKVVGQIVRQLKKNGNDGEALYAQVNKVANRKVGIVKKDKMTSDEDLQKRHAFLSSWLRAIRRGEEFHDASF